MNSKYREFAIGCLILASMSLAGCGGAPTTASNTTASNSSVDQDDHDHESHGDEHEHAHPESFAEALTEFEELRAEMKTAFAADDLDKADGPVHQIGRLLEELPELAAKESLSESDRQQVKQAVDSLMDNFAALDERVHGGDSAGKSYDEVAPKIDEAFAKLKAIKLPEHLP